MEVYSDKLRNLVVEHGYAVPKRHGFFHVFRFPHENTYLQLDSWNGALDYMVRGNTVPIFYFGMNEHWDRSGEKREKQPRNVVRYYIYKLKDELRRRNA